MLKSIGFATTPLDWLQSHYQDDVTSIWIMIYKDPIVVKSLKQPNKL